MLCLLSCPLHLCAAALQLSSGHGAALPQCQPPTGPALELGLLLFQVSTPHLWTLLSFSVFPSFSSQFSAAEGVRQWPDGVGQLRAALASCEEFRICRKSPYPGTYTHTTLFLSCFLQAASVFGVGQLHLLSTQYIICCSVLSVETTY